MEFALRFWRTLLDNLVLMMVLLPLFGAVLALVSARYGTENVRRTALTNVLLTFALSLLMIAHYHPPAADAPPLQPDGSIELVQMRSVFLWLERATSAEANPDPSRKQPRAATGLPVRFDVGVDGLSLWPIALVALLMIPVVILGRDADGRHPAAFYALLLVTQSAAICLFAALDVLLFCVCLQVVPLGLFFLIGLWGEYGRRRAAARLFVFNFTGGMLVTLALLGVVLSHAAAGHVPESTDVYSRLTFSMPRITGSVPQELVRLGAGEYWNTVRGWLLAVLLIGFAVRAPLVPFHTWFPASQAEAPPPAGLLLTGTVITTAGYGIVRFVLPVFPELSGQWAPALQAVAVAGALYAGLLTLAQNDPRRIAGCACVCHAALAAAAMFSQSQAAIGGAVLHLVGVAASVAGFLLLIGLLEQRYRTRELSEYAGLAAGWPRFAWGLAIAAGAVIGIPGLSGFTGSLLVLGGIFADNLWLAAGGMAALLLVAWAHVWLLARVLWGGFRFPLRPESRGRIEAGSSEVRSRRSEVGGQQEAGHTPAFEAPTFAALTSDVLTTDAPNSDIEPDPLAGGSLLALMPLVVVMVTVGLTPRFFLSRIEPSLHFDAALARGGATSVAQVAEAGAVRHPEDRLCRTTSPQ